MRPVLDPVCGLDRERAGRLDGGGGILVPQLFWCVDFRSRTAALPPERDDRLHV